jgi:type III pantothenate kinase
MTIDYVVDIGNSRIKWGRCTEERVGDIVSLPLNDPEIWQRQLDTWQPAAAARWCLAGVNPPRRDALVEWLRQRFEHVTVLHSASQLSLHVALERPDAVGIDRLLDAVAANARRAPGQPAIIVDAGSAVTVDWLDETGAFRGGAIAPGLRLMSQALNAYTALLPLVSITMPAPPLPGTATRPAIEAGLYWMCVGGINMLLARLCELSPATAPTVLLTGGDAPLLASHVPGILWPEMTLECIRIAAAAQALQ